MNQQTIGDYIGNIDPLTGDRIRARLSHEDALRQLSIAVGNFVSATMRFSRCNGVEREAARANAVGAEIRLMDAHADASLSLSTPAMGEPEFVERRLAE